MRRRIIGAVGLVVAVAALLLWRTGGVTVPLTVDLGAKADHVREVDLKFLRDGAVARDLTLRFPDGAPTTVRRDVRLKRGDYEVGARLVWDDGRESHVSRDLTASSDGETIDLSRLR